MFARYIKNSQFNNIGNPNNYIKTEIRILNSVDCKGSICWLSNYSQFSTGATVLYCNSFSYQNVVLSLMYQDWKHENNFLTVKSSQEQLLKKLHLRDYIKPYTTKYCTKSYLFYNYLTAIIKYIFNNNLKLVPKSFKHTVQYTK